MVAATQMACGPDALENLARATVMVHQAQAAGAQIIVLQELFATPYFCQEQHPRHFALAHVADHSPLLAGLRALAKELAVVLPVSFFERHQQAYFNSLMMIDADGRELGLYRKSHLPQGPGYQEKYYFSPGDTGFQVWDTRYGRIGAAICWDQWFPEAARVMALMGAELLCYPSAIGSEPQDANYDSHAHWQRVMQGHAAANMLPVVASNRIGLEQMAGSEITFYGGSFITDETGALLAQATRAEPGIITASFDLTALRARRAAWGLSRDRRPDLYGRLLAN